MATTAWFEFKVTLQAPEPEQAPPQPVNTEPAAGAAARLTTVPEPKLAEQVAPQLMPAGLLDTDPLPVPPRVTARVTRGINVAVTAVLAFNATVHALVPVHAAPLHPANTEPGDAAAVRTTVVPGARAAVQLVPQFMPPTLEATLPVPAPVLVTDNVYVGGGAGSNLALTAAGRLLNVTAQVLVPVHAPVQPAKTEPGTGVASRLTDVPDPKDAVQAFVGQLMPAGTLTTDPVPVPDIVTPNGISRAKFAMIALSEFISKVQVPVPAHWAALQPANTDPGSATAVRTKVVP